MCFWSNLLNTNRMNRTTGPPFTSSGSSIYSETISRGNSDSTDSRLLDAAQTLVTLQHTSGKSFFNHIGTERKFYQLWKISSGKLLVQVVTIQEDNGARHGRDWKHKMISIIVSVFVAGISISKNIAVVPVFWKFHH